jgi:hypothetical protein
MCEFFEVLLVDVSSQDQLQLQQMQLRQFQPLQPLQTHIQCNYIYTRKTALTKARRAL